MRRTLLVLALAVTAIAAAPTAANADCVQRDPRLLLASADAGVIATFVERRGDAFVIRVEQVVKGAVPTGEVVVRDEHPGSIIVLSARPGDRLGLGLDAREGGWTASDCDRTTADGMDAAGRSAPPCEVGGTVAGPRIAADPDAGSAPAAPVYILGCLRPGVAPLELRASRLLGPAGGDGALCIEYAELAFNLVRSCGSSRRRGAAPAWVQSLARSGPDRPAVSGQAIAAVRSIRLFYRRGARTLVQEVGLVRVTDPRLLERLGEKRPFAQFQALLPRDGRRVRLVAYGHGGRRLGAVAVAPGLRLP